VALSPPVREAEQASRDGGNRYLGSFSIHANPDAGIDAVQECDGAAVTNVALPGYPYGFLITQDGYKGPDATRRRCAACDDGYPGLRARRCSPSPLR
jgi:hypothetical protein